MSAQLEVCTISEEAKKRMKKFRFRKEKTTAALTFKIKVADLTVVFDEEFEDISIDDLQAELPTSQPLYVLISYSQKHDDGRMSYPLLFVYVSPTGGKPELHMMYAGSKNSVVLASGISKVFEIRSVEELTEEFIKEKLQFFSK